MTGDGGTTYTDITSQVTATWKRISLPTAVLANPSIGFKLAVSGDSFDIDFVQNENGNTIGSPRQTAGSPVNGYGDRSTADDSGGSYLSPLPPFLRGGFGWCMELSAARLETCGPLVSSGGMQAFIKSDGSFRFEGPNAVGAQTPAGQFVRGRTTVNRIAAYVTSAGLIAVCCNGNAVVKQTSVTGPLLTHIDLGTNGSQGNAIHGTVKRVSFFADGILTDSDLINFTKI